MGNISDFIVGLWFVPSIIFIVIPLIMYCGWLLKKAGKKSEQAAQTIERTAIKNAATNIDTRAA